MDGPLPYGDIIGGAFVFGGTAWALYETLIKNRTETKDEVKEEAKIELFDDFQKKKVYFPENPYDFNPRGLIREEYAGTGNGKIIKWFLVGWEEVFEWNEDF